MIKIYLYHILEILILSTNIQQKQEQRHYQHHSCILNTEGKKTAKKRASSVTFYLRTPNASVMRTNFHCLAIDNSLVRLDFDKFLSSVHFDTKFQQNRKLFFHVSYSGVSAV